MPGSHWARWGFEPTGKADPATSMPFRRHFDCLWCGRAWETRSSDDLEGWAALCPECLGVADSNGFLRGRLRAALSERAAAASPSVPASPSAASPSAASPSAAASPVAAPAPSPRASSPEHDDWYLRGGRFSRGPVIDGPWQMELDEVTRWLDAVAMSGTIVELGAGMGWWSTLLADKGELWLYDADGDALDAARRRLMAHGLLAHLHERDPLAAADKAVDVVFAAFFLGAASTATDLADRLAVIRGWLKPGASFVFLEVHPSGGAAPLDGPAGPLWPRIADELAAVLSEAGLEPVEMQQTRSAFVMGRATAAT